MEQEELTVRFWNKRFTPGLRVEFRERCGLSALSRTITTAKIVNGVAMIFVADAFGPVKLMGVRPVTEEVL